MTTHSQAQHHDDNDKASAIARTVEQVTSDIAALGNTLDDYSELLLDYPLQRLQDTLKAFAGALDTLPQQAQTTKQPEQPSLFGFDDMADQENQRLQNALEEKQADCDAKQAELTGLHARLSLLEEAHSSLKQHAQSLQNRLDNIIGSFDATLGN